MFALDFAEKEAIENSTVRKFVVPNIIFKAETYPDLIDWEKADFF